VKSVVYLDAFTLACPPAEAGVDSLGTYIQNLLHWSELRRTEWIDIYTSRRTSEVLFDAGAYPPWHELRRTINCLGLQHIQAKDIVNIVNSFLQRTFIIEDDLSINDLLFDQYRLMPSVNYTDRPGPFIQHFEFLTVLLALHKFLYTELNNQLLVSCPDLNHHGNTQVVANLYDVACSSPTSPMSALSTPCNISAQLVICICLRTLMSSVDPCNIWSNATCDEALRKAIEIFAYQQTVPHREYFNVLKNRIFKFGTNFVASARANGFFDDVSRIRMLLRACVETILEDNLHSVHALRIDSGGNSLQLTRGTDKAWRRDIDRDYHLHYWETQNGFEIADVVHHNDFRITF
jgi:hypothetical protein